MFLNSIIYNFINLLSCYSNIYIIVEYKLNTNINIKQHIIRFEIVLLLVYFLLLTIGYRLPFHSIRENITP